MPNVLQASADGKALGPGYLFPLTKATTEVFEERWQRCVKGEGCGPPSLASIPILFGRTLLVTPLPPRMDLKTIVVVFFILIGVQDCPDPTASPPLLAIIHWPTPGKYVCNVSLLCKANLPPKQWLATSSGGNNKVVSSIKSDLCWIQLDKVLFRHSQGPEFHPHWCHW